MSHVVPSKALHRLLGGRSRAITRGTPLRHDEVPQPDGLGTQCVSQQLRVPGETTNGKLPPIPTPFRESQERPPPRRGHPSSPITWRRSAGPSERCASSSPFRQGTSPPPPRGDVEQIQVGRPAVLEVRGEEPGRRVPNLLAHERWACAALLRPRRARAPPAGAGLASRPARKSTSTGCSPPPPGPRHRISSPRRPRAAIEKGLDASAFAIRSSSEGPTTRVPTSARSAARAAARSRTFSSEAPSSVTTTSPWARRPGAMLAIRSRSASAVGPVRVTRMDASRARLLVGEVRVAASLDQAFRISTPSPSTTSGDPGGKVQLGLDACNQPLEGVHASAFPSSAHSRTAPYRDTPSAQDHNAPGGTRAAGPRKLWLPPG